jgi:DNA-binding transcriptional LysR family regulator
LNLCVRTKLLSLNIEHLHLLDCLLEDRSVTKVAEREGLAQPAVSRLLTKLRTELGDPLLVKSGRGLALTERAELIRDPLRQLLATVAALRSDIGFDPAKAEQTFTIGCADCLLPSFVGEVVHRVTRAGSRLRVHFRPVDPRHDASHALETGQLDLIVSNHPRPREDLRTSTLYTEPVVCLIRRGHPLAGNRPLTLARYLGARHLAPSQSLDGEPGPILATLQRIGYRRKVAATVAEYGLVGAVLTRSDLVFTTGRRFAEHHAGLAPLSIVPAPTEFEAMTFYQLWHQRKHASASNRWLRHLLADVGKGIEHGSQSAA